MTSKANARIIIKYNNLPKIAAKLPEAVGEIVRKAAFNVKANAKNEMTGPKHGRIYGTHRASAPGEAPAVDTEMLKDSITTEFPTKTSAIIAPHTEYAAILELGGAHIAARPYMRPAAEKVAPSFFAACQHLEDKLR